MGMLCFFQSSPSSGLDNVELGNFRQHTGMQVLSSAPTTFHIMSYFVLQFDISTHALLLCRASLKLNKSGIPLWYLSMLHICTTIIVGWLLLLPTGVDTILDQCHSFILSFLLYIAFSSISTQGGSQQLKSYSDDMFKMPYKTIYFLTKDKHWWGFKTILKIF